MSRGLRGNDEKLVGSGFAPATAGSIGIPGAPSGETRRGYKYKRKEAGDPEWPPCQEGDNSGFPRLLEVTEPFSIFPWGSRRTFVRNVPCPSSLPWQQSGHLSPLPAISAPPALVKPGSAADFGSEPRQVAVESSPEGDPALVWVRPDGRLPVTCFPGAQTELFSTHIIITHGEKTRGLGDFFKNMFGGLG